LKLALGEQLSQLNDLSSLARWQLWALEHGLLALLPATLMTMPRVTTGPHA
jgi:hypothetical protein